MNIKGKKVLVTGAGGFIGSHLVEELCGAGADVRAMVHYNSRNDWGNIELLDKKTRANIEVIPGNIEDTFFVKKSVKGCSIVFHLAALIPIPYSYVAPLSYVNTNIKGTLNVLQACRDEGIKVIHTSTSETYGTALYVPIDEKHPLQGQSPYSATKIGADKMAESYFLSFNLPVVTVRPFNTFGPRQSARAIIPTIIAQILSGKKEISVGSLSPVRDFTFVKDTAAGFIRAAECDKAVGETINLGNGRGISMKELLNLIIKLTGSAVKSKTDRARVRPSKSEVLRLICDNRKAKKVLNWKPAYSMEDGLKQTIEFIGSNLNLYKTDIYNI